MSNLQTKAKINFIDFLRPGCCGFPYPYTVEQAFHVFQWFVRTGENHNKYGHSGIWDLLDCRPTCLNHDMWVDRIYSIDHLRKRFHYALLYDDSWNSLTTAWKKDNGIGINESKWIYFKHYIPFDHPEYSEKDLQDTLEKLLNEQDRKLNISLNNCHPRARFAYRVSIRVLPERFDFVMSYGYKNDHSSWDYILAQTENNEPFTDTMFRAIEKFKSLTN